MIELELGRTYRRAEVEEAFRGAKRDGSFLLGKDRSALLVRLGDGADDPSFPDRSTLHWPGEAPRWAVEERGLVHVFVERGSDALELVGEARPSQYERAGPRVRDVRLHVQPARPWAAWLRDLGARIPPAGPPPEAEIAALAPDAGRPARWAALATFIERWHRKPLPSPAGVSPDAGLGPPLLRSMLAAVRAVPGVFRQNRLVTADELAVEDGRLVFLWENQAVCSWATEPDGEDPRVWYRNNDPGAPWMEEPERLSGFLIQAVLFEAIVCAPFGANSYVDEALRDAILARVEPLALGRWSWGGARFHARGGALVMTMDDWVWLGAASPLPLAAFVDLVGPDWDYVAF